MPILVTYRTPQDLVRDYDEQLKRGGLLVRVPPPAGLELYGAVELRISAPGAELTLGAQLVQIFPGVGMAVTFDAAGLAPLVAAVEQARGAGQTDGGETTHAVVDASAPSAPAPRTSAAPATARVSPTDRIQLALHGSRDDRAAILRDINAKNIHPYVLRNPNLQVDEVAAMAKNATLAPDLLRAIAERRDWAGRPDIAIALVRNPKTAIPIAVRLLDSVSGADLRQLAKDGHTRAQIAQAARKKLSGL